MTETTIHQMVRGQAGDGRVVAVDLRQTKSAHLIIQVDGRHARLQQLASALGVDARAMIPSPSQRSSHGGAGSCKDRCSM